VTAWGNGWMWWVQVSDMKAAWVLRARQREARVRGVDQKPETEYLCSVFGVPCKTVSYFEIDFSVLTGFL
jgi:hypothetical protein